MAGYLRAGGGERAETERAIVLANAPATIGGLGEAGGPDIVGLLRFLLEKLCSPLGLAIGALLALYFWNRKKRSTSKNSRRACPKCGDEMSLVENVRTAGHRWLCPCGYSRKVKMQQNRRAA